MNATLDRATYQRARAQGTPARYAATLARWAATPPELEWTTDRSGFPAARLSRDGYDIRVRCEPDYESDPLEGVGALEWPARWADPDHTPPGTVKVRTRNGYAYWRSETPFADRVADFRRRGYARGPAWDAARADLEAEAKAVDGQDPPSSYGVIVTASRAGVELGSASVWGVSADWDEITRDDGTRYLDETARELIPQAIEDARASLARLCETKEGC